MAATVRVYCSHLDTPRAPLPPAYPSSSADFAPLDRLFFCEECDAIRCDECVAVEVASYYCPCCLFDVPTANVRGDKNRCARSCYSCPQCSSNLAAYGAGSSMPQPPRPESESSGHVSRGAPFILLCPNCKWSSKEIGWLFDKPTAIHAQSEKLFLQTDKIQAEYDGLKDHLEAYIALSGPQLPTMSRHTRTPSRHIAQLTQAASRAIGRDVPGLPPLAQTARGARLRARREGSVMATPKDEMPPYKPKHETWKGRGIEHGLEEVEALRKMEFEDITPVEQRWAASWDTSRSLGTAIPQRVALRTKMTKRCPHPTCRHILIQPDTKSVRMPIKMVASNYLPAVQLGRRRRRLEDVPPADNATEADLEKRRRDRRRSRVAVNREEDEEMDKPLLPGHVYTYQLALINPLYDPIQIRLSSAHQVRSPVPAAHEVFVPTAHFTVGALKDAWAYDEEDDFDTADDNEGGGESGSHKRLSLGSHRHRRSDAGVEKRGNVTKVGLEVEVLPGAEGPVEFDLEIRFTYRADDADAEGAKDSKPEYKTFTFWARVCAGHA